MGELSPVTVTRAPMVQPYSSSNGHSGRPTTGVYLFLHTLLISVLYYSTDAITTTACSALITLEQALV
jgi:hypothetical protein